MSRDEIYQAFAEKLRLINELRPRSEVSVDGKRESSVLQAIEAILRSN